MIRVVLFLAFAAVIALGVAWFADRPGDVAITWLGYRIETSIMVAAAAVALVVIIVMAIWAIVRGIVRSPDQVSLFMRHRRAVKGHLAITRGLIAVGSGDERTARKSADEAGRLIPDEPLALLLGAQSAQFAGDRPGAERAFRTMIGRSDTKVLGLRGLYMEAQRRDDFRAANLFAEEASRTNPSLGWATRAVLEYRCAASDWAGALEALEKVKSTLAKDDYRRKRAVLLTARAQALEESDRDGARSLALEAAKLAPNLVPAAAMAGRRLAESNELRKAAKILETAWKANPHPEIAEAYANLRFGDSARDRLTRVRRLAEKTNKNIEGALAVAHAALDAREFAQAREALAAYAAAPTRRVAELMADIEREEHGDEGRAREWMARAARAAPDPTWTADGTVSDRWLPISPGGRLDAFEWKVPLAQIGSRTPTAEGAPVGVREIEAPIELTAAPVPEPPPEPQRRVGDPAEKIAGKSTVKNAKRAPAEAVIPLVHAPDDPGPETASDQEPIPESSATRADPWQRLRQLFR